MPDTAALNSALQSIDGLEIAQLAATMGSIPSPTGREQAMGDFLCQWLSEQGFQPQRDEVTRRPLQRRRPSQGHRP